MLRRMSSWGKVISLARKVNRSRRGEMWIRVSDIFWPPALNKAGMLVIAFACRRMRQFWTKKFLLRTLASTLLICRSARQSGIWNQWYCRFITHCTFIAAWIPYILRLSSVYKNQYIKAHNTKSTFILYLLFKYSFLIEIMSKNYFCVLYNPHLYSEKEFYKVRVMTSLQNILIS